MKYFSLFFLFFFVTLLFPTIAHADNPRLPVNDTRYAARYVSQSIPDPIVMEAGSTREVSVTFRNTGTTTWQPTGAYATAYTVDPRYRVSAFAHTNWISTSQPAKFTTPVAPGETGTLTISLTAPNTPGTYTEEFYLAANSHSWMTNGYFYFKIQVVPKTTPAAPQVSAAVTLPPTPAVTAPTLPQVTPFFISRRTWETAGGTLTPIRVAYKNTSGEALTNLRVVPAQAKDAMFAHDSWQSADVIVEFPDMALNADERIDFTILSPAKAGAYVFDLALATDTGILPGSTFRIPVTVTEHAPSGFEPPVFAATAAPITYRYETEPTIRVGLAKIDSGSMTFVSHEDDYRLVVRGIERAIVSKGTGVTLSYRSGIYTYQAGGETITSPEYLRLEPVQHPIAIATLGGGFSRDINWQGRTVFNTYRGVIELRRADDSEKTLYAINELPLDAYTAGVAEAGNSAPTEFLKAQAIASRTYAHVIQGTRKYPDRYFDVVAHTADQLYLGVGIEEVAPNYRTAVAATRGEIVTHNTTPVLTPYFANSDGSTRGFAEVWGGAVRPWLVAVTTEYDLGRSRYGHGVGMSQRDAMARATAGASYTDILMHYYTGVEVERMYE